MCHGLDGRGGEHAPNIATNPAVARLTDSALQRIVVDGIPSAGMPSFKALGTENVEAVVAWVRVLQGMHASRSAAGNPTNGKRLFFGAARCSSCHMVRGAGGFLGPDLTDYSRTHPRREIADAILNPNKNLPASAGVVAVVTKDGRRFIGIARNEDNFSLQLQTVDGSFHLFMKSTLTSLRREPRSLMPADYSRRLTPAQIDDLVSFLEQSVAPPSTSGKRQSGH